MDGLVEQERAQEDREDRAERADLRRCVGADSPDGLGDQPRRQHGREHGHRQHEKVDRERNRECRERAREQELREDEHGGNEHRPGDETRAADARYHRSCAHEIDGVEKSTAENQCAAFEYCAGIARRTQIAREDESDPGVADEERERRASRDAYALPERREQHDDRRVQEQHEPLECGRDVLQAEEIEQTGEVVADDAQQRELRPVLAREVACGRRAARPPRHGHEERRRVEHPQREQSDGVHGVRRVGELDQDRLERKAEHAEDRAERPDPGAGRRGAQSQRTSPA